MTSNEHAQSEYDRISRTWRLEPEEGKQEMVTDLPEFLKARDLEKMLADDIAKLIDAIETDIRREIEDPLL